MRNKNNHKKGQDIVYGKATIPWAEKEGAWRLPSGKFTNYMDKVVNTAYRMDRMMSGRAKNEVMV